METSRISYLNRLTNTVLQRNIHLANSRIRLTGESSIANGQKGAQGINDDRHIKINHTNSGQAKISPIQTTALLAATLEKEKVEKELEDARQIQANMQRRIVELEAKVAEQADQIQEMDTYAYTVAHGLKTPLSVITFASEMLIQSEANGTPDPDAPELLTSIHNMGHKMARIIEDLLTLTGISQAVIQTEPLDMVQILWEVQERLAVNIEHSGAQIIFTTPVETWPTVAGNRPLVEEVWDNFISNAIKYGGKPPHIELGADMIEDNMVCFWIQDNGHGIPMTTQNRLFKAFNRLHVSLAGGHGLGLAIVDRTIRQLGGQVAVESTGIPGEGSTFSFTLPAAEMNG